MEKKLMLGNKVRRLVQNFGIDLQRFAEDDEAPLVNGLSEALGCEQQGLPKLVYAAHQQSPRIDHVRMDPLFVGV